MRWQLTSCFSGCMRESDERKPQQRKKETKTDSAGNTIPLRDSPWASTRPIQAWVGQPWWDPPVDSCEKGTSAISWRHSLRYPLLRSSWSESSLRKQAHLCPDEVLWLALPLCVLNHLPLSLSQHCRQPLVSNCNATVSGEPVTPQSLCDSSDWAKSNPPSSSSLIWEQSRSPPHSSFHFWNTPSRPHTHLPQTPVTRAPLAKCSPPSVAAFCLPFSVYSPHNTKHIQACTWVFGLTAFSSGCPVAAPEDVTCISDAPQSQALLHCGGKNRCSPLHSEIQRRESPFRLIPCLIDHQHDTRAGREANKGEYDRQFQTDRGWGKRQPGGERCSGESSHCWERSTLCCA